MKSCTRPLHPAAVTRLAGLLVTLGLCAPAQAQGEPPSAEAARVAPAPADSQGPGAAALSASPGWGSGWVLGYSPYTLHYSDASQGHYFEPDEQKHSYVWMLQAEKQLDERQLAGFAVFSNSFGQPSQYAYYGWRFTPWQGMPQLFFKLTGGVIHGYKYPYHKKIPFNNRNGWGLTAIPAIGYDFSPNWGGQINILGAAGLMFQINYSLK